MPNVVVVDDRVTNRNILARLAVSVEEGIRVKTFASPQAALDWLHTTMPDLVITDYKMPGMDGADFVRAFRALPGAEEGLDPVGKQLSDLPWLAAGLPADAAEHPWSSAMRSAQPIMDFAIEVALHAVGAKEIADQTAQAHDDAHDVLPSARAIASDTRSQCSVSVLSCRAPARVSW